MERNILLKNKSFVYSYSEKTRKLKNFNIHRIQYEVKLTISKNKTITVKDNPSLRDALKKLLLLIRAKAEFRNSSIFYYDIDLSFSGLNKQWLKSGLFRLNSDKGIYWLLSQLDQVCQSDSSLSFNNQFKCNVFIVRSSYLSGYVYSGKYCIN